MKSAELGGDNFVKGEISRRDLLAGTVRIGGALAAGAVFTTISTGGAFGAESNSLIVDTRSGKVRGREVKGVRTFTGIPYGASTAGDNRFHPPVAPAPWTGVRDALTPGAPCHQINVWWGAWVNPVAPSEDCLTLNVWSPVAGGDKKPVMVWVHGGGFEGEDSGEKVYSGENLARHGEVVVVSMNHRLNIFGYLYLAGVSDEFSSCANLGQLDLIAALRWVQDNIASFGGDPGNITAFGESGGGAKISVLMGMPAATGLFHKAIVESGSFTHCLTADEATQTAKAVLESLLMRPDQAHQLMRLHPERLLSAHAALSRLPPEVPHGFGPVVDGKTVPQQPWEPGAPAQSAGIPLLVGSNMHEAAYFLSRIGQPMPNPADDASLKQELMGMQRQKDDGQVERLIAAYRSQNPNVSRQELLVLVGTCTFMWRSVLKQIQLKVAQGGAPVYVYRFDWKTPCFGGQWAVHGVEVPFVMGTNDYLDPIWDTDDTPVARAKADPEGARYRLQEATMAAWAAFARTGNPSNPLLPIWPAHTLDRRATMVFDSTSRVVDDPQADVRKIITG